MCDFDSRVTNAEELQIMIAARQQLVDRRDKWLSEPTNQMKNTYQSVKTDTDIIRKRLEKTKQLLITLNTKKNETKR